MRKIQHSNSELSVILGPDEVGTKNLDPSAFGLRMTTLPSLLRMTCVLSFATLFACFVYAQDADKFIYDSHGKRDPFIPLVGLPHTGTAVSEILSIDDVDFQGIAKDARGRRIVIINGEMLTRGSELGALKVSKITDDEAIVIIREKKYTLNLYEKGEKK